MSEVRVVLLGTGTPNAEAERSGPSTAVVVDGQVYLVDAGPGVVRRALQAGLPAEQLTRLFLTHLHSDHTLGLPDLLYTPWTLGRTEPLSAYGPPGTAAMLAHIQAAYAADVEERLAGLEPANESGWQALASEVAPGVILADERVTVKAITVEHGRWPAYAYRFETTAGVVVISGDTAPRPGLAEAFAGADVLVHEVYSAGRLARREPAWQRYHRAVHTSGLELGELAAQAEPGLLVLTHQLYWGASDEELLAEVRQAFAGSVASGRDLDSFALTPRGAGGSAECARAIR